MATRLAEIVSLRPASPGGAETLLLHIVRTLVRELGSAEAAPAVDLDSNLETDVGVDSLERAELLLRLE